VADRDKPLDNYGSARVRLCQHCHGAPGMVTAFADVPFTSVELEELLREGGKFTWAAGPLAPTSATARAETATRSSNFIVEPKICYA
jgi:hypothetical protein